MSNKKLHPSVQKFKDFVKAHPKLVLEVRKGRKNWQEIYEDWYLLGEDDPKWEPFLPDHYSKRGSETIQKTPSKNDIVQQLMMYLKN